MQFKNETELNRSFRSTLTLQGMRARHIRESDHPGTFDLLVYVGSRIVAWVELKIDDGKLEPSQKEFARDTDPFCGCCYVARGFRDSHVMEVYRGATSDDWSTLVPITTVPDFRTFPWLQGFDKWRRVATVRPRRIN